jgi:hypothetical protein
MASEEAARIKQIFKPGDLVPVVLDGKEVARVEVARLLA